MRFLAASAALAFTCAPLVGHAQTAAPAVTPTAPAAPAEIPVAPAVPADPPAQATPKQLTPEQAVQLLSKEDLAGFVSVLREHYVAPEGLAEVELARATVQGLLARLGTGVSVLDVAAGEAVPASPFRSEVIEGRMGYVRLGAINPAHVAELDAALQKFTGPTSGALILDLRATPAHAEFEQAAEVCKRFAPKGKVLFTVRRPQAAQELILTSKEEPRYRGLIIVLVDADTAGSAEIVAATLRAHANAMIVGQKTKGEAVEFAQVSLPSGRQLRVAVAEVSLPDQKAAFAQGVMPDLPLDISQEETNAALQSGLEAGVSPLVSETERPRMNEAALVAGTNPEFDAAHAAQQRARGEKPPVPTRDLALQRAVDLVTTIGIYRKK